MTDNKRPYGRGDYMPAHNFLTVREHFAGLALSGLLAAGRDAQYGTLGMTDLARASFELADAMVKASAEA